MAKNSKKLEGRVLPERLVYARTKKGLTQSQLADELCTAEVTDRTVSVQLVSLMETGKRRVPLEYNNALSKILEVSLAYLQGLTDDPLSEVADENVYTPDSLTKEKIPYDRLFRYDQQPVFVEFPHMMQEPAWCIYDKQNNRLVSSDIVYQLSASSIYELKLSVIAPDYITKFKKFTKKSLSREDVMRTPYVYVVVNSSDPVIRSRYEGWYHHNENKTNLINAEGLTLPYDGLNINYVAYREVDLGEI